MYSYVRVCRRFAREPRKNFEPPKDEGTRAPREETVGTPWNLWGIAQSISFPRLAIFRIAASGTVAKICGGFLFHRLAGIFGNCFGNVAIGDELS